MARAKRTERAEARRRFRALLAEQEGLAAEAESAEGEGEEEGAPPRARGEKPGRPRDPLQPDYVAPKKVGFFGAVKAAYRPVHYRDDLRLIWPLITRTHAIWPVAVLTLAALAITIPRVSGATYESLQSDSAVQIVVTYVLYPYLPMLPAMIAGFMAPRATWLAGMIACTITTIGFMVLMVVSAGSVSRQNAAGNPGISAADVILVTIEMLWIALPLGALLAALTGWYKRFLALTGPAAALSQQQQAARQKQAAKRGLSSRKTR